MCLVTLLFEGPTAEVQQKEKAILELGKEIVQEIPVDQVILNLLYSRVG
jgi:hypothetical protein